MIIPIINTCLQKLLIIAHGAFINTVPNVANVERKSRDLVLAQESTGDVGCFDACVKNRIIFCFWMYSQN